MQKKRKLEEDSENLKKKKKCMKIDIKELISSADELALKAEETKKMTFCIQSNNLRKTAMKKEVEVKNLEKQIEIATKELKG